MALQVTLFSNSMVPNPTKVAIFLEELGLQYVVVNKLLKNRTSEGTWSPEFLKMNPLGRLPVLIDHTNNDYIVKESGAILLYLAERFDPSGKYSGSNSMERFTVLQWQFFEASEHAPKFFEYHWYRRFHPVKVLDHSVYERYQQEIYKLWQVLENRLETQEWIALDRMTVVDIALFPWIKLSGFLNLDLDKYPKLAAYIARLAELPSVQRAYKHFQPLAQL